MVLAQGLENDNNYAKENTHSLGNAYDFGSIMHYAMNQCGGAPVPCFTTIPAGQPVGQCEDPSDPDLLQIRLMYQCISGERNLAELQADPCTDDCKCFMNEAGCGTNDEACAGSLACIANTCVTQPNTSSPTKAPTKAPTNAPTNAPTKAPTKAPTNAPTPTPSPTPTPTAAKAGKRGKKGPKSKSAKRTYLETNMTSNGN